MKYIINVDIVIEAGAEVTAHDEANDILGEALKRKELESYVINYTDEE